MKTCTIYILISSALILFLLVVVVVLRVQQRRLKEQRKTNSQKIISRIHEQERIMKELHQTRIEKETLEKILKAQLTDKTPSERAKGEKGDETIWLVKTQKID